MLHYNWNRYYDPVMGMYTQVDRISVLSGGGYLSEKRAEPNLFSSYSYAAGNPNYYIDWNGLVAASGRACWGIKCLSIRFACEDKEKENGCGGTTAGKCELEIGLGIGFGGGFSIDPNGKPNGTKDTFYEGGFRGWGSGFVGFGGFGAGLEGTAGLSKDQDGKVGDENRFGPSFGSDGEGKTGLGFGGGFEGFIRF